jgi:hypothetical protein
VSFNGIFPQQFIASAIEIESIDFNLRRSKSKGGVMQIGGTPGHQLMFKITTPPLDRNQQREIMAFIDRVGSQTPFTVSLPVFSTPRGSAAGSPSLRTQAAAGSRVIELKGLSANASGVLKGFDLITFANHTKGYFIDNVYNGDSISSGGYNSNSSGQTTIRLTKPLLRTIPTNTSVEIDNPTLTVIAQKEEWNAQISAANSNYVSLDLPVEEYIT